MLASLRRAALAAAVLTCLLPAVPAAAETPADRDPTWVVDGNVDALARGGQTLYLGGEFTRVSPATGGGVILDAGGARVPGPEFDSDVEATVADGAGGVYAAGTFEHVDGAPANVVHVRADGTLDPAFHGPAIAGFVRALALSDQHLYIGGSLSTVAGVTGPDDLVRVSRATGAVDPSFKPAFDAFSDYVGALTVANGLLYVGGSFVTVCKTAPNVGCVPRDFAAALDLATGNVAPWAPSAQHDVNALLVHDGGVYLGGSFDCVGAGADHDCADVGEVPRQGVAKVHPTTGALMPSFDARLGILPAPGSPSVFELIADPSGKVIATGPFTCAGYDGDGSCADPAERVRRGIVRLDKGTGVADTLVADADGAVSGAVIAGGALWVGGSFTHLGGQARAYLGALDVATGAVLPADPSPNAPVRALAPFGGRVFAGGDFSGLGGVTRSGLAAIDLQTGVPTDWAPAVAGTIRDLHVDGGRVYAGGGFVSIDGAARGGGAAFDLATGALLPWNPAVNGSIEAIATAGDVVYLGGGFFGVGAVADQAYLAAVGAADGLPRPFPKATAVVRALAAQDGILYVGGDFGGSQGLGGAPRSYAGAVELAGGTVTTWKPEPNAAVTGIAPIGDGVVLGGQFTHVGGTPAPGLARVDRAQGAPQPGWSTGLLSGTVTELARDGERIVAGGNFGVGPSEYRTLIRIDAATGTLNAWNPTPDSSVYAVAAQAGAVYAGGAFDAVGGRAAGDLAAFTPAPAPLRAPAIAGAGTLTCDPGDWEGGPLLSVAWLRDGAPAGAGAGYPVGAADGGHGITCRVTARSIRGTASADSAPVAIPRVGAKDTLAPRLSKLSLSVKRPRVKRKLALRVTASEAARLTVTVQRAVPGRRKGKRCIAGRKTGRKCVAFKNVAVMTAPVKAAANRIALPRKKLTRRGSYRLVVRAVDAAGNRSAAKKVRFQLRR